MAWKCPECGTSVDDARLECNCGYAFYKVLGVKPDASAADIKNAYRYLRSVWQSDRVAHDPLAQKKARARMEKIEEAYLFYKRRTASVEAPAGTRPIAKIAGIAVVFLLCIAGLIIYFRSPGERPLPVHKQTRNSAPPRPRAEAPPVPAPAAGPTQEEQAVAPAETQFAPSGSEDAGEQAIDRVKKSHVLDRVFPVEAVVKRWSETSAGKLQIIGWQSKKVEGQVYVVSYTASDGLNTEGFYFEVNLDTGVVRDVAKHPDLQQKYGIHYK